MHIPAGTPSARAPETLEFSRGRRSESGAHTGSRVNTERVRFMQEATMDRRETSLCELDDAEQVRLWLSDFENALQAFNRTELEALFVQDSHWRDLFALTWNLTPTNGRDEIVAQLLSVQPDAQARHFTLAE